MELMVRVPGSCGELLQGMKAGNPFLVTCPVGSYTTVRISDALSGIHGLGRKSLMALEKTLTSLGKEELPWGLCLESSLPRGKGMASSSADIAATVVAVALAFDYRTYPEEIMRMAASIEPTDGVFYPQVVCINHMNGDWLASYHGLPAFRISIFDTGGAVDTLRYHEQVKEDGENRSAEALALFEDGWQAQDEALIAEAAVMSALNNQSLLYKEGLEELLAFVRQHGALGINVAHSGTVIGVLWPEKFSDASLQLGTQMIRQRFPHLVLLMQTRLQGGGVQVAEGKCEEFVELFR
jgi:L-threonine kinase